MKRIVLAGYTGRENRGCEAILRSTADLLRNFPFEISLAFRTETERKESLDWDCVDNRLMYHNYYNNSAVRYANMAYNKIFGNTNLYQYFCQKEILHSAKGNSVLHIGGDTYCYGVSAENIALVHHCKKRGIPIFLWGASIDEDALKDKQTFDALASYDAIYVREQISFDLLVSAGIQREKIIKMSDPAFTLKAQTVDLDEAWWSSGVIGINLSPLASEYSKNGEVIEEGIKRITDYILNETEFKIALIPHVYKDDYRERDYQPLNDIKNMYHGSDRIWLPCKDYNCSQLKYIISKCGFLLAARTHASIAAYSSCVPTAVLGYSVKSKGIAYDLFSTHEGYVLPVQDITDSAELFDFFAGAFENRENIKKRLNDVMPAYKKEAEAAAEDLLHRI